MTSKKMISDQHIYEVDPDSAAQINVREEPGWEGVFTRDQYAGAKYKNGECVRKKLVEPGDLNPAGALATVLGSIGRDGFVGYFVEWHDSPRRAVFIAEFKIEAA